RVKGIEKSAETLRVETYPHILDGKADLVAFDSFGRDEQLPGTIRNGTHRVRGVAQQVQNDLLELDAIACDQREIVSKFRTHDDAVSLQVSQRERNDFLGSIIQVDWFDRKLLFAEESTQTCDHVGGAVAVANGAAGGFTGALDVWRIG